jgi:predicted dienelactone hydrolase
MSRAALSWKFRSRAGVQITAIALLVLILCLRCTAQETVKTTRADGAETALRVYRPAANSTSAGCAPLGLISPGAGGTENGYAYLAEGLRDRGWLAIVVGHAESGPRPVMGAVLKSGLHQGLLETVTDPTLYRDRLMDVGAALAWADKQCAHPFRALLGHSMGSETVMFEAGAENKLGVRGEDRFGAYVAISTSGPGSIFPEHAWSKIAKPVYVLTGTKDKGLEGGWEWRTRPYDDLPAGCKWLGVIDGATHMNFAGAGVSGKTQKLTLESVGPFLDGARGGRCTAPPSAPGITLKLK